MQFFVYNFFQISKKNCKQKSQITNCHCSQIIATLFAKCFLLNCSKTSNSQNSKTSHNKLYRCNDISVNANRISVRLNSKWQRINTVTFCLRDISTPLVGVVFKHKNRSNIRTDNKQMLIWRHICFSMASLIAQCSFKMVNIS